MSIPFDRDAIRRLMEAAARRAPDDLYYGTPAERRKYKKMSKAQRQAWWDSQAAAMSPEVRPILDEHREKQLDAMPNLTPRKR